MEIPKTVVFKRGSRFQSGATVKIRKSESTAFTVVLNSV